MPTADNTFASPQAPDSPQTPVTDPFAKTEPDAPTEQLAPKPKKPRRPKRLRLRATDPLPEAGRAIMAFHFARLRKLEPAAVREEEEAIHDMRVAIRRVRAAFRIARAQYKPKAVRGFNTELRALADKLGAARDLDVILKHGLAFAGRQPPAAPRIDAWLDYLRARRAEAQQALLQQLDGKRFKRFTEAFEVFLNEPGAGVEVSARPSGTPRVCDMIPAAIWDQYSVVRAYAAIEHPPLETLHALRIEFKRLRYLLEFFKGLLGARAATLIEQIVRVQDHLGLLQDASVASRMLREYVAEHVLLGGNDLTAVAAYLSEIQNEIQACQEQFPDLFQHIVGQPFRKQLAQVLSRM
ncbi:MAG TPA: CHAD domain-containing protein [Anaerolineae bacterium]|nr:CHAD domain-containing protein [Anaerolineae bacterium]